MDLLFFLNSIALGVGLAMDAFSVSIANGLNEPDMPHRKMNLIAGTYAGFQFAMPMIGWLCVHIIADEFTAFQQFIPWIALALLAWIGGGMLREGITEGKRSRKQEPFENTAKKREEFLEEVVESGEKALEKRNLTAKKAPEESAGQARAGSSAAGSHSLTTGTLLLQGLATSIDALSVGFTIAEYGPFMAVVCCLLIAVVTYFICMAGLRFGRKFGEKAEGKASILGGLILIGIGLEIFIRGVFF